MLDTATCNLLVDAPKKLGLNCPLLSSAALITVRTAANCSAGLKGGAIFLPTALMTELIGDVVVFTTSGYDTSVDAV